MTIIDRCIIKNICDAYETGNADGTDNPSRINPYPDDTCEAVAYEYGKDNGVSIQAQVIEVFSYLDFNKKFKVGTEVFHKKSGNYYLILAYGTDEKTRKPTTIYKPSDSDEIWVRLTSEFEDGRFIIMPALEVLKKNFPLKTITTDENGKQWEVMGYGRNPLTMEYQVLVTPYEDPNAAL